MFGLGNLDFVIYVRIRTYVVNTSISQASKEDDGGDCHGDYGGFWIAYGSVKKWMSA